VRVAVAVHNLFSHAAFGAGHWLKDSSGETSSSVLHFRKNQSSIAGLHQVCNRTR
jgi:hypothetical protein